MDATQARLKRWTAQMRRVQRMVEQCDAIGMSGGMLLQPLSDARDALKACAHAWSIEIARAEGTLTD